MPKTPNLSEYDRPALKKHYPWTRRWSLRSDASDQLSPVQQYLQEGHSQKARGRTQGAIRDFGDERCLVLLGPAGAGKSEAAKQYRAEGENEEVFAFDLGTYETNIELRDELQSVLRDAGDARRVVLLFDSLDECPARAPLNAAVRYLEKLDKQKRAKVNLRVVCRAAYWAARPDLEEALYEIWDEVSTADIESLRREDVEVALRDEGIDAKNFWKAVGRAGAHALTKQPLTLRLLLREYLDQDHQLPSTQTALYASGCRRLAEEHHARRRSKSRLSPDQVLETLRPLAAAMILGQRSALWVGDSYDRPDEDLILSDILGSDVRLPSGRSLRRDDLLEVKNTGFLKGTQQSEQKPERLAWVERTFAEFLTAQFLKENNLTLGQTLDLLAAPNDPERRIAPPMHEVASWLAAWRTDLFEHILGTDPAVLLTGDVASYSEDKRHKLTRRLLDAYNAGDLIFIGHVIETGSRRLATDASNKLLASYIASSEYADRARKLAIKLISWNRRAALLPDLRQLAFDSSAPASLRAEAVEAIGKIARGNEDEDALRQVVPLLDTAEEAGLSIRGAVLEAAYPAVLSFTDAKPHLRTSTEGADGRYQFFIERSLVPGITLAELPSAFEWLADQEAAAQEDLPSGVHAAFEDLEHALFLRAAETLIEEEAKVRLDVETEDGPDAAAVTAALAGRLAARADRYSNLPSSVPWYLDQKKPSFDELWAGHASLRRRVVPALLQAADEEAFDRLAIWLAGFKSLLQASKDLSWVLQEAAKEIDAEAKRRWLQLAGHLFTFQHADILRPHLADEGIRRFFAARAGVSSDAAAEDVLLAFEEQRKEDRARQKKWEREQEEREAERQREHPTASSLEAALEQLQSTDDSDVPHPWQVALNHLMSRRGVQRDITDVREGPAWRNANADLRARVLKDALGFLETVEFDYAELVEAPQVWKGLPTESVAALRLLFAEGANPFDHWDEAEWTRWAALVAAYEPTTDEDEEVLSALLKLCYAHAPEAVVSAALARIGAASRLKHGGHLTALRKFAPMWDERLVDALSDKISDPALNVHTYGKAISHLLSTGFSEPWQRAVQHVTDARFEEARRSREKPPGGTPDAGGSEDHLRHRALEAGGRMLEQDAERAWPALWPALEASDDFADRLIRRSSRMLWGRAETMLSELSAGQLETLYRQLSRLYPHAEDPKRPSGVAYSPTFRDDAARFRGAVLQQLVSIGASAHVARIRADLPDLEWLAETQRKAEEVAMRAAWNPHKPEEVLRIVQDKSARLARTGTELLEVVTEALQSMKGELRGHPPAVYDLWNSPPLSRLLKIAAEEASAEAVEDLTRKSDSKRPCYVFKEETDFSDYVARYLGRQLRRTVIGREVEVEPGNKPDLRVSAFASGSSPDEEGAVHIIVEVKGSWNNSLYTAMEEQLAGRYLATSDCRRGIFLVAWPHCERWHESDWRKSDSRRCGIDELRRKLNKQAAALSQRGRTVKAVVMDVSLPGG